MLTERGQQLLGVRADTHDFEPTFYIVMPSSIQVSRTSAFYCSLETTRQGRDLGSPGPSNCMIKSTIETNISSTKSRETKQPDRQTDRPKRNKCDNLHSLPFALALISRMYNCLLSQPVVSRCCRESSLELAKGGGTLVFELGVEQIAAADGGNVEACCWKLSVSLSFLSLSLVICSWRCGDCVALVEGLRQSMVLMWYS